MFSYDALHYDPPAPVAEVLLRKIDGESLVRNVVLLIDTGADTTLLPRVAVEHLGANPVTNLHCELQGFDGTRTLTQAVDLDMIFLNKIYRGRYLLIDGDRGILGRDILAHLVLLLDGPQRRWTNE